MKEITVTSRYHGTIATVRPHKDARGWYITRNQANRLLRRLCPVSGCQCGGVFRGSTRDAECLDNALTDIYVGYQDKGYLVV